MRDYPRNSPCWCGSGKKYKHCHLGREDQNKVSYYKTVEQLKKNFSWKECLHPDASKETCSPKIIRSHTVRRSADLKPLSENGHVYQMSVDVVSLLNSGGVPNPIPIGINNASTFYGFCSHHDQTTFAPLETQEFASSPQQCFLLGFRALIKEIYTKKSSLNSISTLRNIDKGISPRRQVFIQQIIDTFELGLKSSMSDLEYHRKQYVYCLRKKDYKDIRSVVIHFDTQPNIICSGMRQPEYNFLGLSLQDLRRIDLCLDMITLTIFTVELHTVAAFVWHNSSDKSCATFIKSLLNLPSDKISHAIIRFAFDSFENLFLRPSWWEHLQNIEKEMILNRMKKNTPLEDYNPPSIIDDGLRIVDWRARDIILVNYSA